MRGSLIEGADIDGKVYDIAAIKEYAKEIGKAVEFQRFLEQAEKVVGKDGRMVMLVGENGREFHVC